MGNASGLVLQLLMGLVEEAPNLVSDAKTLFDEIAGKDDGLTKVIRAAAIFSALAGHAANSAHTAVTEGQVATHDLPQEIPNLFNVASSTHPRPEVARSEVFPGSVAPVAPVVSAGGSGGDNLVAGGGVVAGGAATDNQGRPLDAQGNPILNAADQAAAAGQI